MKYISGIIPKKNTLNPEKVDQYLKKTPLSEPPLQFEEKYQDVGMNLPEVVEPIIEEKFEVQPEAVASGQEDVKQAEASISKEVDVVNVDFAPSEQASEMQAASTVEPKATEEASRVKKSSTAKMSKKRPAAVSEKADLNHLEEVPSVNVEEMDSQVAVTSPTKKEPLKSKKSASKKTGNIQAETVEVVIADGKQLDEAVAVSEKLDETQAEVQSSDNAVEIHVEESNSSPG